MLILWVFFENIGHEYMVAHKFECGLRVPLFLFLQG
jgi:hypothetical protein